MRKTILFGILTFCSVLFCENKFYANYYSCFQNNSYYLEVEPLYWKTMHCPVFVARRFQTGTDMGPRAREEFYLTGEYDPGVRARIGTKSCDWFADLSYLYFFTDEDISEDIGNFPTMIMAGSPSFNQGNVTAVKGLGEFRYQNLDGRFGTSFCLKNCLDAFLYGNVRWVKIDFKNIVTGIPTNIDIDTFFDNFRQDATFNGGGFGFGVGALYGICGAFSLRGNVGVMAIIGESRVKNFSSRYIEDPFGELRESFLEKPERWCHILPAFDFRFGLAGEFCLCRCPFEVEVGYELNYYSDVMLFASNTEIGLGRAEVPSFGCQDVGFAGPYFKLSVMF